MTAYLKRDAFLRLQAKIAKAVKRGDPAPWFDASWNVESFGGDAISFKLPAATKVAALGALLIGDIIGLTKVGDELRPLPLWAWSFASWGGTLHINWPVKLPDDLLFWRDAELTHFEAESFDRWLAAFKFYPVAPDDLPPASAPIPGRPEKRVLPDTGTVTLVECVSWVAWQFSLKGSDMMIALEQGEFGTHDESEMREAFARVLAEAKAGALHFYGRFQSRHRGGKEKPRKLDLPDLIDFARFNPMDEGLERGVRRQNIWRRSRRRLAEHRPRLGVDVMRRACGAASADVRWSVALSFRVV